MVHTLWMALRKLFQELYNDFRARIFRAFGTENRFQSWKSFSVKRGNPLSLIMGTALAKSRSARGVSHQPGFILERSSEKFQRLWYFESNEYQFLFGFVPWSLMFLKVSRRSSQITFIFFVRTCHSFTVNVLVRFPSQISLFLIPNLKLLKVYQTLVF